MSYGCTGAAQAKTSSSQWLVLGRFLSTLPLAGEEPHKGIVASISNENPAFVTCVDDERLEFEDGELVTFSEVKGMPELNGIQARVKDVKVCAAVSSPLLSSSLQSSAPPCALTALFYGARRRVSLQPLNLQRGCCRCTRSRWSWTPPPWVPTSVAASCSR